MDWTNGKLATVKIVLMAGGNCTMLLQHNVTPVSITALKKIKTLSQGSLYSFAAKKGAVYTFTFILN